MDRDTLIAAGLKSKTFQDIVLAIPDRDEQTKALFALLLVSIRLTNWEYLE